MRTWLALGLTLVATVTLVLLSLRKMETDALDALQQDMLATGRAVSEMADKTDLARLQTLLEATQIATGSRIRIVGKDRTVLADSLNVPADRQASVAYRPEVQDAFEGNHSAYTRFSDESERSLALFVTVPSKRGVIYISHSTDGVLQRLGSARRTARNGLVALTVVLFMAALYMTGHTRRRLARLAHKLGAPEIDEGVDNLIASLEDKIAQLEDEKQKTRDFLEDVAHELKTPITGLCGSVDALLQGSQDERLLRNLQRESQRLAELTSRLLELQKLEYYELKIETFDLRSLLETACDNYEHAASKRGVTLELRAGETLARGDANQLQRVVENLLDNAIRVSPENGVVKLEVEPGEPITVRVKDEGPGLHQADLFERHRSAGKPGSLGIGLAIVAEVIRLHGQQIGVRPRESGGSEFFFTLAGAQAGAMD